ncbi:unnamed protein product, partial [Chrysoparadoxa australica]
GNGEQGQTCWSSAGGLLTYKSFKVGACESHIDHQRHLARCHFDGDAAGSWSLCVLKSPELVKIYRPDGSMYDVTLPCHADLVAPLAEGLLIQRDTDPIGEFGTLHHPQQDQVKAI